MAVCALVAGPAAAQEGGAASAGGAGATDGAAASTASTDRGDRFGSGPLSRPQLGDRGSLFETGRGDLSRPDVGATDALGGSGLGAAGAGSGLGAGGFGGAGAGGNTRLGFLGDPLGLPAPADSGLERNFFVRPSLGGQLLYTDNVQQGRIGGRSGQADLITTISPGLFASGSSARFAGTLNYTPLIQFYAETPGQDRFDQRLSTQASLVLVPGVAFLDARGLANTQAIGGGFTGQGLGQQGQPLVVDRRNNVQTFTGQLTPYVVRRFGGLADAQFGYNFTVVRQDGADRTAAFRPGQRAQDRQPFFTAQNFTSHELFALSRTGENFGRFGLEGRARGTLYEGTGVLDGAHRASVVLEGRYVVVRGVAVLVEGGYENQRYGGQSELNIDGPIWSIGARLEPGQESFILARYGRRDGFNSAFLDASVGLGGRTRVNAGYSDRLSTSALRNSNLLSTATIDPTGTFLDSATGAPLNSGDSALALQSGLLRVRRASASISQAWERDTVTLTVSQEQRSPISNARGTVGFAQRGTSGGVTWGRDIGPRTTGFASFQYGTFNSGLGGRGEVVTGSLSLVQQLGETLVGNIQYVASSRSADALGGTGGLQNAVLAGLRKDF